MDISLTLTKVMTQALILDLSASCSLMNCLIALEAKS